MWSNRTNDKIQTLFQFLHCQNLHSDLQINVLEYVIRIFVSPSVVYQFTIPTVSSHEFVVFVKALLADTPMLFCWSVLGVILQEEVGKQAKSVFLPTFLSTGELVH